MIIIKKFSFVFILALLLTLSACAQDDIDDPIDEKPEEVYIAKKLADGIIEIVEYQGEEEVVIVPEEIEGNKIVAFSEKAFEGTIARRVEFPTTLETYGDNLFIDNTNLEEIVFHGPVPLKTSGTLGLNDQQKKNIKIFLTEDSYSKTIEPVSIYLPFTERYIEIVEDIYYMIDDIDFRREEATKMQEYKKEFPELIDLALEIVEEHGILSIYANGFEVLEINEE